MLYLADAHLKNGDVENALKCYNDILNLNPSSVAAFAGKGILFYMRVLSLSCQFFFSLCSSISCTIILSSFCFYLLLLLCDYRYLCYVGWFPEFNITPVVNFCCDGCCWESIEWFSVMHVVMVCKALMNGWLLYVDMCECGRVSGWQ